MTPSEPRGTGRGKLTLRLGPGRGSAGGPAGSVGRWVPAVGGSALVGIGLARRSPAGVALALAGGGLVYRAVTGRAPLPAWLRSRLPGWDGQGLLVERTVTILRPREELYGYWRSFENLPRFMRHLQSVTTTGDRRSHWVVQAPAGTTVEWDAEIVEERPNELIRWRSLPGAPVANRGEVRFTPAPGDRGTEVHIRLEYDPPAGPLGATVAQLLGEGPDRQVREDLRGFKQLLEAGEIPTNDGQPMGSCLKG